MHFRSWIKNADLLAQQMTQQHLFAVHTIVCQCMFHVTCILTPCPCVSLSEVHLNHYYHLTCSRDAVVKYVLYEIILT